MLSPPGTRAAVPATNDRELHLSVRSHRIFAVLRAACGVVLFIFVVYAVAREWTTVKTTISRIGPWDIVLSMALVFVGLESSVLTWRRSLQALGSNVRLDAASRIYLIGQLGKYVPGSLWALAAQAELGRRFGIPWTRGATTSLVAAGLNVVTGLALGVALVPSIFGYTNWPIVLTIELLVVLVILLSPRTLARLTDACLRAVRRPALDGTTWRRIRAGSAWSVASWLAYGTSVWVIAVAVGAPRLEALPLCLAAVPLAMTAGFLVVIAPSGIGVREAVLVAALAPVLSPSDALAVAVVARFLFTVGDLLAAVAVLPLARSADP